MTHSTWSSQQPQYLTASPAPPPSLGTKHTFAHIHRQRDILMGLVPQTKTNPDPWDTYSYSIIFVCSIWTRSTPVCYQSTDVTVDADLISVEIDSCIAMRLSRAGDVLILNNAVNHTELGNSVFVEWLWQEQMMLVFFSPFEPRSRIRLNWRGIAWRSEWSILIYQSSLLLLSVTPNFIPCIGQFLLIFFR